MTCQLIVLHSAARRYCIERSQMWLLRYCDEREQRKAEGRYPRLRHSLLPEDYAVFPRYHVLDAILWEVERIDPGEIDSVERLRELILLAGHSAESFYTRPLNEEIALRSMAEERDTFRAYVAGLGEGALQEIEPLPYRRVLRLAESERLWSEMTERWGTSDAHWHPFISTELPPNVVAFQEAWFHKHVPTAALRQFFTDRHIERLWELREIGTGQGMPEYLVDLGLFEPRYDFREGYWTSDSMDWLIYVSHDSSVTVAGEWLLAAVKSHWPAWSEHLYTDWRYERPSP